MAKYITPHTVSYSTNVLAMLNLVAQNRIRILRLFRPASVLGNQFAWCLAAVYLQKEGTL